MVLRKLTWCAVLRKLVWCISTYDCFMPWPRTLHGHTASEQLKLSLSLMLTEYTDIYIYICVCMYICVCLCMYVCVCVYWRGEEGGWYAVIYCHSFQTLCGHTAGTQLSFLVLLCVLMKKSHLKYGLNGSTAWWL